MSAPLGTFNSEERVQISTAIRLARQLPPGRESPALSFSLYHSLFVSCTLILVSFAVSLFLSASPTYRAFTQRVRVAFGTCAEEISNRVGSRGLSRG